MDTWRLALIGTRRGGTVLQDRILQYDYTIAYFSMHVCMYVDHLFVNLTMWDYRLQTLSQFS